MLRVLGRNLLGIVIVAGAVFISMMVIRFCDCLRFGGFFGHIVILAVSFMSSIVGSFALSGRPCWDVAFVVLGVLGGHYSYSYYGYIALTNKPDMVLASHGKMFFFIVANSTIAVVGYTLVRGFQVDDKATKYRA
nr:putative integron gene cassette protein [uncultured bacterium]